MPETFCTTSVETRPGVSFSVEKPAPVEGKHWELFTIVKDMPLMEEAEVDFNEPMIGGDPYKVVGSSLLVVWILKDGEETPSGRSIDLHCEV